MKRSRKLSLCGAAAVTPFVGLAQAAVYYEMTTASESSGFGGGNQEMEIHSYIDGDFGRIEFVSSDDETLYAEGAYMLTRDAGGTIYLVNPAERTYMVFDLDALLGMAGNMMNAMGGVMEMSFENVSAEKLGEEPGGELLGYSTMHYTFRTAYDMNIKVMGFNRSSSTQATTEVWCTDEISSPGFDVWLRPDRFRTGNEDLDELISQQMQMPDCMPLRIVSTTSAEGAPNTSSETRVTAVREESSFDPDLFALPADYTETSFLDQIEMPEGVEFPQGFPFGGGANAEPGSNDTGSAEPEQEEEEGRRPFGRFRDLIDR